jgi:hypothetical protein
MSLPDSPSLDRLRRLSRAFQRACMAGDSEAVSRLATVFPEADARALALTMAQTFVARDHGFPSWPALKATVEARRLGKPKSASDIDAESLAAEWFALAGAEDLRPLLRSLGVGKGRLQAAREVMRRDRPRYRAFQSALLRGLEGRREKVRAFCAHTLDTFGEAWTRPALIAAMDDPVPRVRWAAIHAVSCHACGERSGALEEHVRLRIVAAVTGDPSRKVRFHATHALAAAGDRASIPLLLDIRAHETDTKLRDAARYALWSLSGKPAIAPRVEV